MMIPCVIRGGGLIGDTRTVMGMRVSIGEGSHIGIPGFRYQRQEDGSWKELEHHGKVIIGSDVDIGYNCTVCRGTDRDTTIGDGTKIDNMVHIGHNCTIGRHVIIGAGAIIGGSCVLDDYAVVKLGEVIPARTHVLAKTVGFGACHWDLPIGKKLLITDLDGTLWDGVLADDDMVTVYIEYAKQLKELSDAGILLAMCSKNDWKNIEGFDDLMEQSGCQLRLSDFVATIVNWESKDKNIRTILSTLNLLPESTVFIDDSPHERDWVSRNIPGLTVCDDLDRTMFQTEMLTLEDKKRLRMYKEEQLRQQTKVGMTHEEWIKSLNMELIMNRIEQVNVKNNIMITRCYQLLDKTNQMKLNNSRGDIELGDNWYFTLSDKFGDYGIIAVVLLEDCAKVKQFAMSCRVMGRGVEDMIFDSFEIESVDFKDTGNNKPMADFLRRRGLIE